MEYGLGSTFTIESDLLVAADGYRSTIQSVIQPPGLAPEYSGNFVMWGRTLGTHAPPPVAYNVAHE